MKKQWLFKIKRVEGKYFKVTNSVYVCSNHFVDTDYRKRFVLGRRRSLKDDSVPSRFSWSVEPKIPVGRKPPRCRNGVEPQANIPKYKYPSSKPKKTVLKKIYKTQKDNHSENKPPETELLTNSLTNAGANNAETNEALINNILIPTPNQPQTEVLITSSTMKNQIPTNENAAHIESDKYVERVIFGHYQRSEESSMPTEPAEYIPKLLSL